MQEPDPSQDVVLKIDGKSVTVPQGKPKINPAYQASRFGNSEYLVRIEEETTMEGVVATLGPLKRCADCGAGAMHRAASSCVDSHDPPR